MRIDKFMDKEKQVLEGQGVEINGTPVRRQRGMIYWYRWGRHTFDIRVMRTILGLPVDHVADKWFLRGNSYEGDSDGALRDIVCGLRTAMGGLSFRALMKEHDRALKAQEYAP